MRDIDTMSILNSFPDGIYITDTNRRIIFWSKEAERITGWLSSDVLGRCCRDQILCCTNQDGQPVCGREHCPLHGAMVTGRKSKHPHSLFVKNKSGHTIPVESTMMPIINTEGMVIGGIAIIRDVTPQNTTES